MAVVRSSRIFQQREPPINIRVTLQTHILTVSIHFALAFSYRKHFLHCPGRKDPVPAIHETETNHPLRG